MAKRDSSKKRPRRKVQPTSKKRRQRGSPDPGSKRPPGVLPRTLLGLLLLLKQISTPLLEFLASHPVKVQAPSSSPSYYHHYCALLGDQRSYPLEDGSKVTLNSTACVTVELTAHLRMLQLESGEALFEVQHDSSRPFVVNAGPLAVKDAGTRFDVYIRQLDTQVTVLDGAVQISRRDTAAPQSPISITAGWRINIPEDRNAISQVRHVTSRDIERLTAWVQGMIMFESQTVGEVFAEFARYQNIRVEAKDPKILAMPVVGVFHTTDVSRLLHLLSSECIRAAYDRSHQHITLSRINGQLAGGQCQ